MQNETKFIITLLCFILLVLAIKICKNADEIGTKIESQSESLQIMIKNYGM